MGFIGAVALLIGGLVWMLFFVLVIGTSEVGAVIAVFAVALGLTLFGLGVWWVAIRPDEREEDLFEGERGTGMAVVLVCAIALAGFFGWSAFHADTWTGLYDGWTDAPRPVRY
jgi:hypothetical protein